MKQPLLKKFATSLVAALTTIALLLVLGNSGTLSWFPPLVVFSLAAITLLAGIVFPFAWQIKDKNQTIGSQKIDAVLYAIIRYTLAFNLASFGWKKLFGLQFVVPHDIASAPMNQQSGEWLTWFYFGYSPAFGVMVAFIQIAGAYGLLFRKSILASAVVLFAFMLNLMLINIFYHLNAGALLQSVIITIGIAFLIASDYKKLIELFFRMQTAVPSMSFRGTLLKNLLRLSAILLSLLFVLYLKFIFMGR